MENKRMRKAAKLCGNILRKENKNLILNSKNNLNQATQEIQDPTRDICT